MAWISTVFILVLRWMGGSPAAAPHPPENSETHEPEGERSGLQRA
jgi:hypothetical protein